MRAFKIKSLSSPGRSGVRCACTHVHSLTFSSARLALRVAPTCVPLCARALQLNSPGVIERIDQDATSIPEAENPVIPGPNGRRAFLDMICRSHTFLRYFRLCALPGFARLEVSPRWLTTSSAVVVYVHDFTTQEISCQARHAPWNSSLGRPASNSKQGSRQFCLCRTAVSDQSRTSSASAFTVEGFVTRKT